MNTIIKAKETTKGKTVMCSYENDTYICLLCFYFSQDLNRQEEEETDYVP